MTYLWEWWSQLNAVRRAGMHGLEPITYVDIDAWARLTGQAPDALEVEGLGLIDAAWRHPGDADV